MKKKLLSLFMACAMILALAVPAFAADKYNVNAEGDVSDELIQQVTIATRTFVPTVKLTLPTLTEPSIVLNPYKITYSSSDGDLKLNGYDVGDTSANGDRVKQVISPVYFIKNETDVKLNYTVAVTGSVEGGVTFSNDPVSLTEKNKKAHVALMVANKEVVPSGTATDPSLETGTTQDIFAASIGLTKGDVEEQYLKTSEVKFTAPKSLADASSGANFLAFQFKGDLTRQPTPNSWTDEDKIGAVITFTFTPESKQDYTADKTSTALAYTQTASGGTATDLSGETIANILSAANLTTADLNATPAWNIENAGAYGAKFDSTTTPTQVKFAAADLDKAAVNSTGYTTSVILSFKDVDGIPRTIEYKAKITVAA